MKPIIGLTAIDTVMEDLEFYKTNKAYIDAILEAGGIPVEIPACGNPEELDRLADMLDGFLSPGGYDVAPLFYGEEPCRQVVFTRSMDDEFEFSLVKKMAQRGKPILGICRGLQVINVAFGGSLWQDIPSQLPESNGHLMKGPRYESYHSVELEPGSRLAQIFGSETLQTNTFHHQAVKDLAPGFKASAHAKDGVVEGIEHESQYIVAVQWHPEGMFQVKPQFARIFQDFVAEAAKKLK